MVLGGLSASVAPPGLRCHQVSLLYFAQQSAVLDYWNLAAAELAAAAFQAAAIFQRWHSGSEMVAASDFQGWAAAAFQAAAAFLEEDSGSVKAAGSVRWPYLLSDCPFRKDKMVAFAVL